MRPSRFSVSPSTAPPRRTAASPTATATKPPISQRSTTVSGRRTRQHHEPVGRHQRRSRLLLLPRRSAGGRLRRCPIPGLVRGHRLLHRSGQATAPTDAVRVVRAVADPHPARGAAEGRDRGRLCARHQSGRRDQGRTAAVPESGAGHREHRQGDPGGYRRCGGRSLRGRHQQAAGNHARHQSVRCRRARATRTACRRPESRDVTDERYVDSSREITEEEVVNDEELPGNVAEEVKENVVEEDEEEPARKPAATTPGTTKRPVTPLNKLRDTMDGIRDGIRDTIRLPKVRGPISFDSQRSTKPSTTKSPTTAKPPRASRNPPRPRRASPPPDYRIRRRSSAIP